MSAERLARIARLYGQLERVRLVELQEAAAAVAEAEGLRVAGEVACEQGRAAGRGALAQGEIIAWRLAESVCETAEVTIARAAALRAEREPLRASASDAYRVSRLRTEQVTRMAESLREMEAVVEGRREQAATDDRHAARLCWTRMKTG